MSYENPQIIVDNSGQILARGIAGFGSGIAAGITKFGEAQKQAKKEAEAERLQQQRFKNQIELEYNRLGSQFKSTIKGKPLSQQLNPLINARLKNAADARIALDSEVNPEKRAELNKIIIGADEFLTNVGLVVEKFQGDGVTYKDTPSSDLERIYGITGNNEDKLSNQLLLSVGAGYGGEFKIADDFDNNNINISAYGNVDGKNITKDLNGNDYLQSNSELIFKIPQTLDNAAISLDKTFRDDKGNINLKYIATEPKLKRFNQQIVDSNLKPTGKIKVVEGNVYEIKLPEPEINLEAEGQAAYFLNLPYDQQKAILKFQLGYEGSADKFFEDNPGDIGFAKVAGLYKTAITEAMTSELPPPIVNADGSKTYYKQAGSLTTVEPKVTKPTKLTEAEKREITRVEDLQQTMEDVDNLLLSLNIKKNPAGIYSGSVNMNNLTTQERIIASGFSVSSVTAKQTEDEKDEGIEPEVIGYKLKDENTGKEFEVPVNVAAPIFMQKILLSRGAKRQEAEQASFSFIPKPQLP